MKRYKLTLTEQLDNSPEVRNQLIESGAEDYAEWMALCHCAYIGNKSSFNDKVKEFMKEGLRIIKTNVKVKKLKTADEIYEYIDDIRSKIIKLSNKIGL